MHESRRRERSAHNSIFIMKEQLCFLQLPGLLTKHHSGVHQCSNDDEWGATVASTSTVPSPFNWLPSKKKATSRFISSAFCYPSHFLRFLLLNNVQRKIVIENTKTKRREHFAKKLNSMQTTSLLTGENGIVLGVYIKEVPIKRIKVKRFFLSLFKNRVLLWRFKRVPSPTRVHAFTSTILKKEV